MIDPVEPFAASPIAPDAQPLAAPPSSSRRRPLRLILRGLFLALLVPVVFALLIPILLIGQEVTAPSWITRRIETQAETMLDGGSLRFGAITVTVSRDLHPRLRLTDSELRDAAGTLLARVPMVEVLVSPRGLILEREVLPQEIVLTGAELSLRRAADGSVAIAFDRAAAPVGRAASLAALPETLDRLFDRPALAALETLRARGLIVNYADARARRAWTLDDGRLLLDLRDDVARITAEAVLLSGRAYVTTLALDYDSPRDSPAARIDVTVTDVAAADIATQSPALAWLAVLDAPLSARLSAAVGADGSLGTLTADLQIKAGVLQPDPGARPIGFDAAGASLRFDPATGRIGFDAVDVQSDLGALHAEGVALLREVTDGWPAALLGQFTLTDIRLDPVGLYPEPLAFPQAHADFRLRLDPFTVTVGGFGVTIGGTVGGTDPAQLTGRARISASPQGWQVAIDAGVDAIDAVRVLDLWPQGFMPGTRSWFARNLIAGRLHDVQGGLRIAPGAAPVLAVSHEFSGAEVRAMRQMPPITGGVGRLTYADHALTVALDAGRVLAPEGGAVDMAGSALVIADTRTYPARAEVRLRTLGTITAALSLLDQPPFEFLSRAGLPVTLAQGRAQVAGSIRLPLMGQMPPGAVGWDIAATLRDVSSEALVPGRRLAAARLELTSDRTGIRIGGPLRLGGASADLVWTRLLGTGAPGSQVTGTVELSERFMDEFRIGLPPGSVSGAGTGQLRLDLPGGGAPIGFALDSDLRGLRLQLPVLGWSKPAGTAGRLEVVGLLGAVPVVERIALDAAGLELSGRVDLRADGGLERARLARVRLNGWLDAPVDLVGRGRGRPVGVEIGGGMLDLRRATFGAGGGGEGGPVQVALDRLQVSADIALTGFRGDFDAAGGLSGNFAAAVNGGAAIRGTLVPRDGRSAVRIVSDTGGPVLRDAGLLRNATGGAMELTLLPAAGPGSFDGRLAMRGLRVQDAPALASLLNAISVVGLLQQMAGQGLVFDEVEADFRLAPDTITVLRASAIGPGLGISLDGFYTTATRVLDFQGVVSPFYLLNAIGSVLTRRGEGLIGFNFTLRGPVEDVQVGVNPLSALTPGMFREIFRRPPPTVPD